VSGTGSSSSSAARTPGSCASRGDDDAGLLFWGAQWLDEHRDWSIAAMRFQYPAAPGERGLTATVIIELSSPGTFPPGHEGMKPWLGPWAHGVPPMPV
jgi:hypothetical protein